MIDALWAGWPGGAGFSEQVQVQWSITINLAAAPPLQQRFSHHHQKTLDLALPAHTSCRFLELSQASVTAPGAYSSSRAVCAVLSDLYLRGFWASQHKALIYLLLPRKLDHAIIHILWMRKLRWWTLPKWGDCKKRDKALSWSKRNIWHLIF